MPKTLSVAGYNVTLNPDAKEAAGATAIGEKLKTEGWDLVAASEDFNYHSELWNAAWNNGVEGDGLYSYNSTTHRGKITASASVLSDFLRSKSPLFNIDGLCLFYRWNRVTPSNESWTSWNAHYGYTEDGADGMIDKGYRYYLVTLATGEQIDVYILHMDAETSEGDLAARNVQLRQLADAIIASHNGRPIVVIGDTNCRYTRDKVEEDFINRIEADERFTVNDPFIDIVMNGICPSYGADAILDKGSISANRAAHGYDYGEVVDKIFYINTTESGKRVKAKSYKMEYSFVNDEGEPLADHWPVVVTLDIHDYDPDIDDTDLNGGGLSGEYYIRNLYTKQFLKQGGWYDTQAVTGSYGSLMKLTRVTGKYVIQSPIGYLSPDPVYMDATSQKLWSIYPDVNKKSYTIRYINGSQTRMLSAISGKLYPFGPNRNIATTIVTSSANNLQRWELLTKEQLIAEMRENATETSPYDCTFLLPGANFDVKENSGIAAWQGWPVSATKMSYNSCDGTMDIENGNPCAEVYCASYSGIVSYGTEWEVSQTLTGLPLGLYKVAMQGFYRDGNMNQSNPGAQHAYLYARSGGVEQKIPLQSMYAAQCSNIDASVTSKDANGFFIPNSMADATYFFNAGYYDNEVSATVTDGTLTVAVGKPVKTKSTSGWTCFDNFRLYYLGDPQDLNSVGTLSADEYRKLGSERKVLENGRVVIMRDGVRYNTAGQRIR